jgi:hypothetical protein
VDPVPVKAQSPSALNIPCITGHRNGQGADSQEGWALSWSRLQAGGGGGLNICV